MRGSAILLLFVSAAVCCAEDQSALARAAAGCGPANVQFDVKTDKGKMAPTQSEPGKALIVVFEDERHEVQAVRIASDVTTRIGLDGQWVGANHGSSYLSFATDPGEHHLCAEWQSHLKRLSDLGSAITVTTEPGKTYFFRVRVEERNNHPPAVKLEPIDLAQGQFMFSSHSLATSQIK